MKMVHGNALFIREEAKLARNTLRHTFSTRNFTSLNSINFPEHIANYIAARNSCSRDYDMMLGGVSCKSWYHLRGFESFAFSQRLARNSIYAVDFKAVLDYIIY